MRAMARVLPMLALAWLVAGCMGGKGPGKTPEATAQAMLAAMQAGDAQAMARLYDYEEFARRENENWEEIPQGQRDLITDKLAEVTAGALQTAIPAIKQSMAGARVGAVQENGETATVEIKTAQRTTKLQMVRRNGKWYVKQL